MKFVCNVVKVICRKVPSSQRRDNLVCGFLFLAVVREKRDGSRGRLANGSGAGVVCRGETVVKIRRSGRVYDRVQVRPSA